MKTFITRGAGTLADRIDLWVSKDRPTAECATEEGSAWSGLGWIVAVTPELFEQMLNRVRSKLHEGFVKVEPVENSLSKNATFEELDEFSYSQKEEILKHYLSKYPDKYKSKEDVQKAIDNALVKDREGTISNLKNCR